MASSMFGGIHPASRKENTRRKPLMLLEHPPAQVALPLAFHGGPSSLPLVKAGERVYAGQPIARPEGEDGAVLHASVSGRVEAIRELPHPWGGRAPAIVIANDGDNTPWPERPEGIKLSQASQEELMVRIEAAGIVDMGSDPLPAQVKILRARGRVDTLIVNAAECEPYITADLRLLQERGEPILKGTRALAKVLGVDRVVLADLSGPEERTYTSNGYTLRVAFGPESAQVTVSDCPTQDCVHMGEITRGGQSIVCLPARIVVQLEGGAAADDGVDLVIG